MLVSDSRHVDMTIKEVRLSRAKCNWLQVWVKRHPAANHRRVQMSSSSVVHNSKRALLFHCPWESVIHVHRSSQVHVITEPVRLEEVRHKAENQLGS